VGGTAGRDLGGLNIGIWVYRQILNFLITDFSVLIEAIYDRLALFGCGQRKAYLIFWLPNL
jgi:hypothetical protein